ncbi:hypothetical protein L1987_37651 [Smallanthus sonchifolius]|uniref:Uncharacterized protein n=1 Tax=Smallanthus sonchifolius TaxID=185202 RepID=A0ACB9HGI0_9ASTR|nr:hypothetical protein L1987_37651 [Smallanthus sonchifolius]
MKASRFSYAVAVTTSTKIPKHHNDSNGHKIFILFRSYSSSLDPPFSGVIDPISIASTVSSPDHQHDGVSAIDAGSSYRKPISLWPGMYHSLVTNALWQARSIIFDTPPTATTTAGVNTVTTKTPSHSRTTIHYPFSSDYILREQYRNPWNGIRVSKLLEDLDALAGTISFKHCFNYASMADSLLLIEGAVTWVGRSSMEIQLEVLQSNGETSDPLDSQALVANFTFVGRDSKTGKSAKINQITPETEKEKLLWKEAEERNRLRKERRVQQKKEVENEREAERLNSLLAEGRVFIDMPALADRDSILIQDTCLQNSLVCMPQQRNTHGRIFGGFLMRRAFELAFATAYAFAGSAPLFLEVDHVDFLKPDEARWTLDLRTNAYVVLTVIYLKLVVCFWWMLEIFCGSSRVLYTELENPEQPLINIEVVAHVTRPELRTAEVSNKFYFTFTTNSSGTTNSKIRSVVPATEEEARRVIERIDAEKC